MIVFLICYPKFESPTYLFRTGQEEKAEEFWAKYLTPNTVKKMMEINREMLVKDQKKDTPDT